ncbi:alpha-1,2-mannosyltransferase ALG9 isoform X2 [Pseudoliparis swirei]|uniref:alpha-1,2-mannosyltransferase ALG9 isoform X2 n=1 Tax=Pseudoliparis swirei TaxID=2059687 RepID=UPI0024BE5E10|nr:alpha-1,2-mannosyltransferase ALG9 isoform X2 [Pseudoliparis swirei]
MAAKALRQRTRRSSRQDANNANVPAEARPPKEEKGGDDSKATETQPESVSRAGQVWAPEGSTAFKCLLSARFCAALLSNISDCDETFNYWEPMHYLLYGTGMQTWEYSPLYAIRSYAYLWLHALPACLHAHVLQTNKVLVFYFVRCVLAFSCCVCELYFYKAVCKKFGLHVGRLMLAFLVLSTGMFCSSAAFLPSSFCMYTTLVAMTGWFQDSTPLAVLGVAAGAIVGWPFSALVGIPIAFDLLVLKRQWKSFVAWLAVALLLLLVPLVAVDSYFYGKLVIAPLNILLYNVFTPHGPDLYGTEPWHFYFSNGILNFNLVFALALLSLPLTALMETLLQRFNDLIKKSASSSPSTLSSASAGQSPSPLCRNATTSCSSATGWSTTRSPPTGWLSAPSWFSQCCPCLAPSPSSKATTPLWTFTQSSIASPRTRVSTRSLKAALWLCVWAKSGTASPAASCSPTTGDFTSFSPSSKGSCLSRTARVLWPLGTHRNT